MEIVELKQLLTVGGFIALMLVALFLIRNNGGKLKSRIEQGRRMRLSEVTALGPDARAILLTIDDRDYLVLTAKRQPPVVTPLGDSTAAIELDDSTLARIAA